MQTIDKVTVTERTRQDKLSDAAEAVLRESIASAGVRRWDRAAIDVIPHPGASAPVRPFLHRGDWLDDGQGTIWTVVTALLHEDDDSDDRPYLWHEYEVVRGMRHIA